MITTGKPQLPTIGDVLGLEQRRDDSITVLFNGSPCHIPVHRFTITMDDKPATLDTPAQPGCKLAHHVINQWSPLISDVLLAADYKPLLSAGPVTILLNGRSTEYTAAVNEGDRIEVVTAGNVNTAG
jgi:hypothetical protein